MENVYENYKKQLDEVFNRYHTKNAICYLKEDGSRLTLTYGQLKEAVFQIGRILANVPLCPSDRIAVLSPHTPFAALVIVALSYLGYTAVPLAVSLPAGEIARLLTVGEVETIVRRDGFGSNQADTNTKRKLPFVSEKMRAVISDDELRAHCEDVKKYYMNLQINEELVRKSENYYRAMVRFFAPLNLFKRTKVLNAELLPIQEKGLIFVSNHIGSYDQFFIAAALGSRPIHYLVKQKVTTWPIRWNLIYRPSGAVVVDQQSVQSWKNAKEKLVQLLLHGHDIFVFPEGTRRGADNLGVFQAGVAQIVQESGCKVVTLAIKNTSSLFSVQSPVVCIGKTLQFEPRDGARLITQRIQEAVYHNYEEIQAYECGWKKKQ